MRDDFEISVLELDALVETAAKAGAVGARMIGAASAAPRSALVRGEEADDLAARVRAVFAERGWPEPAAFPVLSNDGAGRL